MARILNYILGTIFFILLIIVVMMIFQIPPFNRPPMSQSPVRTETPTTTSTPATGTTSTTSQTRVVRDKSYLEFMERAQKLEKTSYPSLAIAEYQSALKKFPNQLDPLYAIGKIHLRTENFQKAEETFQIILQKKAGDLTATINLAYAYLGQRQITEAKNLLDPIVNENQELYFLKGIIAAYFGDYQKSRELLDRANALPGTDILKSQIGNVLGSFKEYDFNLESPTVHLKLLLSRSFDQIEQYQMAIGLLFEITKEKSDYRDAWILLGHAYLKIQKYNDALEALQRAKDLDPDNANTYFFLALAQYSLNQYQNAINNLLKARDLGYQPDIQIQQKLAEIYLLQKNFEKSAESYQAVLTSLNADPNYYIKPIYLYLEKINQPEKAVQLGRSAVERFPDSAMSHNLLGWALIFQQKYPEADQELKTALKLDPNLDAVYLNYGLYFEKQNQLQQALLFYKKANQLGINSSIGFTATERYNRLLAQLQTMPPNSLSTSLLNP